MMEPLAVKWDRIYSQCDSDQSKPVSVLADNAFLLPKTGAALDLACGLGSNSLFLAAAGLATVAWDISAVAVAKLQAIADENGLNISACRRFIEAGCFPDNQFDVVVVARFLDRALCDAIIRSLKPGGLLFYQTFTRTKVSDQGPKNPGYLLDEHELLELFAPLRVIYYRDNGLAGDVTAGLRNEAQLIGQKRNDTG